MTNEQAIAELEHLLELESIALGRSTTSRRSYAVRMAIEALKQPEVKCLKCDHLKSCMYAWDVDCGCEFFKVNGVHPREKD